MRMGLVYPSFESRAEIEKLVARTRSAAAAGRAIRTARRFIRAPAKRCRRRSAKQRMEAGEPYALRLDMAAALGARRRFELARRRGGLDRRRSRRLGRRGAGAQGFADELSSLGRGRRCAAGRHACRARARSLSLHQRAPPAAGAARAAGTLLPPPPADSRFGRAQAFQIESARRRSANCARRAQRLPISGE